MGIKPDAFSRMCKRLARQPDHAARDGLHKPARVSWPCVLLGIDPALRRTGFGVLQASRDEVQAVCHGTIVCPRDWTRLECLRHICLELERIISQACPTIAVVEGLVYVQNTRTSLVLGEVRGAILATLAARGLDVYEISPRRMKQAIAGYGGAHKSAVAKMVAGILGITPVMSADETDALALALAGWYELRRGELSTGLRRL